MEGIGAEKRGERGLLIVLEGPDGCGKTTQAEKLVKWMLSELKIRAYLMREPGSTSGGERIRGVLLERETGHLELDTEVLLYSAARIESSRKIVEPKLREGIHIVSDRDYCSTLAYQGDSLERMLWIHALCRYAVSSRVPDMTLFYKPASFEEAMARISRNKDRIESKGEDYARMVWNNYFNVLPNFLKEREDRRIVIVRNTNEGGIERVHEETKGVVREMLKL